jgi:glycosyltransferase involved in cell wall biosynthesis
MRAGATLLGLKAITLAARTLLRLDPVPAARLPLPGGRLRVLFLAHYRGRSTGTRYRLAKWAEHLRALDHVARLDLPVGEPTATRLEPWHLAERAEFHVRLLVSRLRSALAAGLFDVAVLHLNDLPFWEYGAPFLAREIRRRVPRLLLDLDDLPVVGGESEVRPRVRALAAAVDGLVLGNPEIARHLPGRPWHHVPTCVDPAEWPATDRSEGSGPPLLGWVGTAGNLRHLRAIAPALAVLCRGDALRLRVICSEPPDLPDVPMEFVRWSAEREVEDLRPVDIGLAPLADGPAERCKCGLKALQHMAAGAAVVASPVGALRRIVRPGATGLFATDIPDWTEALRRLARDRPLVAAMGREGRHDAETRWSFAAREPAFLAALRGPGTGRPSG